MLIDLVPHPAYPSAAIEGLQVQVERPSEDLLLISWFVRGRLDELFLPEPAPPIRSDNLWQTTCFEAFLAPAEGTAYFEFNFSPSSQWAAYDFAVYRDPIRINAPLRQRPEIGLTREEDMLEVLVALWPYLRDGPYRLGLAAVIEETSGAKSYWALSQGGDAPDFHDRACFQLDLPPAPAP